MHKNDVIKVVNRNESKDVPLSFDSHFSHEVRVKYGEALNQLINKYPSNFVIASGELLGGFGHQRQKELYEIGSIVDEFGVVWRHNPRGVGPIRKSSPIDDPENGWDNLDEYINTYYTNYTPSYPCAVKRKVEENPDTYVISWALGIFQQLRNARGDENTYMDLYLHGKEVDRFLNEACLPLYIRFVQTSAQEGADAVAMADDFGSQRTLIINPKIFREKIKPLHRRIVEEIHKLDMHAFLHSDGNIEEIMRDIVEIGYDILHPLEPVDARKIVREFGDNITFCTGINVVAMAQNPPEEVENQIREAFDIFDRKKGGFLLSPTNTITPDTSFENISVMFQTAWGLAKGKNKQCSSGVGL